MKLVPNWRKLWRAISVRCMIAAGAIEATWLVLPPDLKSTFPPEVASAITIGLMVLGVAGRMVRQPGVDVDNGGKADSGRNRPDAS